MVLGDNGASFRSLTMNSATQNPLSDDELLELAEFLVSEAVPETAMDIETLDGFLCALAVGPESVTLGEALPNVWSDDPGVGAAPVWASPDQHGRITGLIGRMYAELAEAVSAEEQIEPLIVEPDGDTRIRKRWRDSSGWAGPWALSPVCPCVKMPGKPGWPMRAATKT